MQTTSEVTQYLSKYISGRTLDFGAGGAKYRDIIKRNANEYIAFDMMPGKNIDVVGDVMSAPFAAAEFDTVISTQVLEHVEKPWIMIGEISRILKSGGKCILTAPFLQPYHNDPGDYFRYTKDGMASLFKNSGFKIVECGSYGKIFTVLSEFIKFIYFDPYKKQKKGAPRILVFLLKMARFLDKYAKNDKIYSNVYIVAEKL